MQNAGSAFLPVRRELENIKKTCIKFKYADKSKAFLQKKIMEKIPDYELHKLIAKELFERDYTTLKHYH